MFKTQSIASIILAAAVAGCSASPAKVAAPSQGGAGGKADDSADRGCQIVLRTAQVTLSQFASPLDVVVDVAQSSLAAGGQPQLQFGFSAPGGDPGLTVLTKADDLGEVHPGFERFHFNVGTFDLLDSGESTHGFVVQALPLLVMPNGDRIFDHNRLPGPFDVYNLWDGFVDDGISPPSNPDIGRDWQVADDPAICTH